MILNHLYQLGWSSKYTIVKSGVKLHLGDFLQREMLGKGHLDRNVMSDFGGFDITEPMGFKYNQCGDWQLLWFSL